MADPAPETRESLETAKQERVDALLTLAYKGGVFSEEDAVRLNELQAEINVYDQRLNAIERYGSSS